MTLTPTQMREDFSYLRDHWAPLDRSFSADQHREFDAIVTAALAAADTMSPADFELEIMRATAAAHNGHTYVRSGRFLHALPIRAWWFADGLYVISTDPNFPELLGVRIEKLGTLTAQQALAAVAPLLSGTEQRIRYLSAFYLTSPELLHRIDATATVDVAEITLRFPDNSLRKMQLGRASPFDPAFSSPDRPYFAFSALYPGDPHLNGRWPHMLDGVADRPLIYQVPADIAVTWIGNEEKILYLRSNQILSSDQAPLDQKLLFGVLQAQVVKRRPKYVVVDLRLNNGGNFFNTILFTQALPRLLPPDGRIFVLVSRATFSAALVTAAMLKANGGDRVVLIGETMGDADRFWAEGGRVTLPNSKLEVQYADGFHDWAAGCTDLDTCYWPAVAFGVQHISLQPEIPIEPTFADYAAGRDPVLAAALALAG